MYIYSTDNASSAAVKHVTTVNFTNLCLYSLAHHYPVATTASASTIQTAFNQCFNATGWTLDYQTTNVMTPSITIDGKTKASTLYRHLFKPMMLKLTLMLRLTHKGTSRKRCVSLLTS
ncbi:hypothetical protein S101258_01385 [Lactiplantibacillus plantarum subsp. plantarum]|uniref:Uncharacterized protein n=1 Tax=Lactiplantibacillus plantarum subsp. plantarum TaxID=337330 RepID=A0A2S3U687_LACPN|nr:hypothetical protein S101258_01385 [Lactiplantibacillus plantarum subsp. plantarum]